MNIDYYKIIELLELNFFSILERLIKIFSYLYKFFILILFEVIFRIDLVWLVRFGICEINKFGCYYYRLIYNVIKILVVVI